MEVMEVTVHYPDNKETIFHIALISRLFRLGEVYECDTGVYERAGDNFCNGHFVVAEISEDKHDVWVDWVQYR